MTLNPGALAKRNHLKGARFVDSYEQKIDQFAKEKNSFVFLSHLEITPMRLAMPVALHNLGLCFASKTLEQYATSS